MKSRLNEALVLAKPRDVALFPEPSVTLSERTLVEPDLALWPRGIESQDVRGPELLLVVEVAVSSIAYDVKVKAPLYASHGVREYWVVDAIRRTIRVHRDPRPYGYEDVEEYDADVAVTAALLPGVTIRLDDLA
jgi:Uma2 family endonuclease